MSTAYRFGSFELQPDERRLLADGQPLALGPRAFDVLLALVERAGQLVSKNQLLDLVWPGLVVEENNLQVQISSIRKILGPATVVTIPGRGYRFGLEVRAVAAEPPPTPGSSSHNLPAQVTPLVGRACESGKVKALLSQCRLVTLIGIGGIGKTRLALQVATEVLSGYPDGVWLADLAPITDRNLIATTVAIALGMDLGGAKPPSDSLVGRLRTQTLLLLLDNCDHLASAVAALVEAILAGAPRVHVLATSREPLAIAGEHLFHLSPLAVPNEGPITSMEALAAGAVDLFVQRARTAGATFPLDDDNARTVAAICRRLDGIPLAIEMAAARARTLDLKTLAEKLDQRFRLLKSDVRTVLPRQKTLHATMEWSYGLLPAEARVMLNRMAIFSGSFALEAALRVSCGGGFDEFDAIDLLAHLVARSLVVTDSGAGGARYRLLETVRAYALEQLQAAGDVAALKRRHAVYFRDLFERAYDAWHAMSDAAWCAAYLPERDNVRSALDWAFGPGGEVAIGTALAGASTWLWRALSLYGEGRQQLERALARCGSGTARTLVARCWMGLGICGGSAYPDAVPNLQRAAAIYRAQEDSIGLAGALASLAWMLAYANQMDAAESVLAEARPLLEHARRPRWQALAWEVLGKIRAGSGRLAEARAAYVSALSLYRVAGADRKALALSSDIADLDWAAGDLRSAIDSFRTAVAGYRQSPYASKAALAIPLANLAGALTECNELGEAFAVAREAIPLQRIEGNAWITFDHHALRFALGGRYAEAARLEGFANAAYGTHGGLPRQINEARARGHLQLLLAEKLDVAELAHRLAEGATMSEDEACELALHNHNGRYCE